MGPGPVFVYEWLTTTRRWQLYALRPCSLADPDRDDDSSGRASVGRQRPAGQNGLAPGAGGLRRVVLQDVVVIELTLVLLAAPAATAGAVCLDKARGTLDHMLATDLSNAEIVLGKLGVRLVPVLGLIACVVPVAALAGLLGGIDPLALAGSFLVAIGCAVLGCSLAMTLSVWGRKTHEVLMITYLIIVLWLLRPDTDVIAAFSLRSSPPSAGAPSLWEYVTALESLLPRLRPLHGPRQGGLETLPGIPGGVPRGLGIAVGWRRPGFGEWS